MALKALEEPFERVGLERGQNFLITNQEERLIEFLRKHDLPTSLLLGFQPVQQWGVVWLETIRLKWLHEASYWEDWGLVSISDYIVRNNKDWLKYECKTAAEGLFICFYAPRKGREGSALEKMPPNLRAAPEKEPLGTLGFPLSTHIETVRWFDWESTSAEVGGKRVYFSPLIAHRQVCLTPGGLYQNRPTHELARYTKSDIPPEVKVEGLAWITIESADRTLYVLRAGDLRSPGTP